MNPSFGLPRPVSRREALRRAAAGFGSMAFAGLLAEEVSAARAPSNPLDPKPPHFPARAKRIIFLFMKGGPSHVDTFDYKPLLQRDDGKPLPFAKPRVQFAPTNNLLKSPWKFRQYGESGSWVSELFPHVAGCVDDICFLHSLHGTNPAHGGVHNWGSAFLPAAFQGTPIGNASVPADQAKVRYIRSEQTPREVQRLQLDLVNDANRRHLAQAGPDLNLE